MDSPLNHLTGSYHPGLVRLSVAVAMMASCTAPNFIGRVTETEGRASLIALAHSLRLRVFAEGVETGEQLAYLRQLGCDQYQGYLSSTALPAAEFEAMLRATPAPASAPAPRAA
jgi:predicted signal transduction protein with EAL and GGDEF domain